jgi:hypothetical protein
MGYMAKDSGGGSDFEPVPVGTHIARCVTVCDLGFQDTNFGRKEKVYIAWEVPGVRVKWVKDGVENEGPALIGSRYTLSIHAKSLLGQLLVSWRGKDFTESERAGFDVMTILNAPCMISVTHNTTESKTYANINAVMRLMEDQAAPPEETELIGYSPTHPQYSGTIDKLPEWMKKLALEGQQPNRAEIPAAPAPPPLDNDFDDDIPF